MAFKQPDYTVLYFLWEAEDGEQVVTGIENLGVGFSAYTMEYREGKTDYPRAQDGSAITAYETIDRGRVDYNKFNKDEVFYEIHVDIGSVSGNSSSVIKMDKTTGYTNNPFESVGKYVKVRLDDRYVPSCGFIKEGHTKRLNFVDPDDPNVTHTGYGLAFSTGYTVPDNPESQMVREYTIYQNSGVTCCYWTEFSNDDV
jgi:hypothetical protein